MIAGRSYVQLDNLLFFLVSFVSLFTSRSAKTLPTLLYDHLIYYKRNEQMMIDEA